MEISGCRMVIILCIWAGITIAVGLMAGLINKGGDCPDESPTIPPTTTTPTPEETTEPPVVGPAGDPFLRDDVYPIHYNMWLYPDFYNDGSTFTGKTNITFVVDFETEWVILHINHLLIGRTRIWEAESLEEIEIEEAFHYQKNQYWVVETRRVLEPGTYVLHLTFAGSLTNGIVGYYKSNYTNALTGEDR